ncbi:MAG TPA: radical SAM family heme chaperone HemW [Candidatus Krumholzibacteria bacterium]|nr:radical SAM family heme chaperone HemW [Candidatus Krumholzibacteria bacterium]
MKPLSLYIHVPFCTRRCSYCSFYHVEAQREREVRFVDALLGEIEAAMPHRGEMALRTIFVGGGTPTVLGHDSWERIMRALAPWMPSTGPLEFTVEMNPEDVTREMVSFLRGLGVNRASLGIQSMHEVGQKVLKRCTPEINVHAIETVMRELDNVSFDVLLGVPKTTPDDLLQTLAALLRYQPRHLSVYGLEAGGDMSHEVERFFAAVDPDRVADEYLTVCSTLGASNYRHYEVSNYAQRGFESLHNRVYWDGGDYLGLGPAAHSSMGGQRFWNEPSLDAYLSCSGPEHIRARHLDAVADDRLERLMLALRTDRGAPREWLARDAAHVDEFCREGLLVIEGDRVRATDRGYLVLNELVLRLSEAATC